MNSLEPGKSMGLDQTSLAIGRLQAQAEATQTDVAQVKEDLAEVNHKLDKLLLRSEREARLNLRHWIMLIAGSSVGGGGVAHALRKLLE